MNLMTICRLKNLYTKRSVHTVFIKFIFTYPILRNYDTNLYKIVFYGTDELSKNTLKALNANRLSSSPHRIVESLHVVCKKSDGEVRRYAMVHKLPINTWPYELPVDTYDVGVVVSFGHLISTGSILACKYGIINAHPSLLPRWRGAAPIFHTILNGDAETGVTITQVSPNKFDIGKILLQETYRIPDGYTSKQLTKELSKMAADMVLKTLKHLPDFLESSYPQPKEGVTYAPKIKPPKCQVHWDIETQNMIKRKLKAFEGFFDVYSYWKDMKVVIINCIEKKDVISANLASLVSNPVSPGFCYFHKRRKILFVKCEDDWCGITSIKIPKKGLISALDFYNGFMSKENQNECYFRSNKNKLS